MQYAFRGSQKFKPQVSIDEYAPLLHRVIDELQNIPSASDTNDLLENSEGLGTYLHVLRGYWERLNARRLEFEAVRPDDRLSRVHEEMVKLTRGTLTALNHHGASLNAVIQGDIGEFQRQSKELESWASVIDSVSHKLRSAIEAVRTDQPTLFEMLSLPSSFLIDLGITFEPHQLALDTNRNKAEYRKNSTAEAIGRESTANRKATSPSSSSGRRRSLLAVIIAIIVLILIGRFASGTDSSQTWTKTETAAHICSQVLLAGAQGDISYALSQNFQNYSICGLLDFAKCLEGEYSEGEFVCNKWSDPLYDTYLDCDDIPIQSFEMVSNDPYNLDADGDGIACEPFR